MPREQQDFQPVDAACTALFSSTGPALPTPPPIPLQGFFHIHLPMMSGHLGVVRVNSKQYAFPQKVQSVVSFIKDQNSYWSGKDNLIVL